MSVLPPGPTAPAADQAREWMDQPLDLFDRCVKEFGATFSLELGGFGTIVILSNPESVRTILKTPPEQFECRPFNESYRYVMGDNALFLQDGENHRRLKRIVGSFFRRDYLHAYAADICEISEQVLREFRVMPNAGLRQWMQEISFRVLLRMVMGDRDAASQHILELFRSKVWRDARSWKPWTVLSRLRPQICELLAGELDYRRKRGKPSGRPDLLDGLSTTPDENGQLLTDVEIQDQVFTLFITAGDAMAVVLTWAFIWMSKLPAVQARLRAELAALGSKPDLLQVIQLAYLERICQEVVRLHTVVPSVSGRRLRVPMDLDGFLIDAGITVAPCEYLVHRRADLYPEPLAFRPDRFLDRQYGPHEYFPFGGGNRGCLGGSLVPLEMKLALATILSRCEMSLVDPEPSNREPAGVVRYGTLLAPAGHLRVEVRDVPPALVPSQEPNSEPGVIHV